MDIFSAFERYTKGPIAEQGEALREIIQCGPATARQLEEAGLDSTPLLRFLREGFDTALEPDIRDLLDRMSVRLAGTNGKAARKTENLPRMPQNRDVSRLATRIKRELGKTAKTKREIALDFAEQNQKKADNLLRQLREFPHLLQ